MSGEPSSTATEYLVNAAIMQLSTARLWAGRRHHLIRDDMIEQEGFERVGAGFEQGFVTNWGSFVNRRQAREIALRAGQVKVENLRQPYEIFSEEIWP